jgi:predicted transposase/invertase (TIGR01784 family)
MSTKIGIRAWVDFAFKKIFGKQGNEICLISLLNSVLDLPRPIESVQYLNPFSMKEFQEDKLICVDVKATDSDGRVFIVEVQLSVTASFVKRALYYASKTYSDQLVEGQGYHDLKATYAVCILTESIWKDNRLHHHFRMAEKGSGEVLRDGIEIHTVELAKYNGVGATLAEASVLEQWCYWIKHSHDHTVEELRELLPGLPFLHATRELREIQEVNEERQMYDSREKGRLDWQSSLLDARAEGRDEGREEGREEGEIKLIRTLREILNISYSDDSEFKGKTLVELQAITASLRDQILKRS